MRPRRLKPTTCAICRHPDRERIEALRASGASLDSLARKFRVHRDAIWRHWRDHVSADLKTAYLAGPATIAELKERAAKEGGSILTRRAIRRGVFKSVADLQAAICDYIRRQNTDPTPFVWTKPAETILAKLRRLPEPSD